MRDITPYPELNLALHELVSGVEYIVADNLTGIYLQGSFAVGDFDEHSDCDFIVAIRGKLSDAEVEALQAFHSELFPMGVEWAKHLEGSYFPVDMLRDYRQSGRELWYLDNGHSQLERSAHCNKIVVRWILREHGVVLTGPEPSTLIEPISVDVLREAIRESIVDSGKEILNNAGPYNNHFYQTFIVLQYCRKLHDLTNGVVASKRTGAEWAKRTLGTEWADLIDRAWDGRPNPAVSIRRPAAPDDFSRTLDFVREVMRLSVESPGYNG